MTLPVRSPTSRSKRVRSSGAFVAALTLLVVQPAKVTAAGAESRDSTTAETPSVVPHETGHALHPPLGVPAGHTLKGGGIAIGYAYGIDRFEGLRSGTDKVSPARYVARTGYRSAPTNFEVERHEFAFMYAPNHRVTAMLEVPLIRKEMRSVTATSSYVSRAEGLGDVRITAIARFMERGRERLYFSAELGIPTGRISLRDDTSPNGDERLPYPMQIGAGVWHLKPGLTYLGYAGSTTWGGQVTTLFRLGDNGSGYTPGNHYEITTWIARRWHKALSTSLRLDYTSWTNTSGADPRIDSTLTPAADPMRRSGQRFDLVSGLDLHLPFVTNQSLAIEVAVPLLESLDGPQPSFDWGLKAGWRWSF